VGPFALALLTVPTGTQTRSIDDIHTVIYSQTSTNAHTATQSDQIRPFRVNVPDDALVDFRKRVLATRWPEKETVNDRSQGVQLAKLQELVRYWGTEYDWRKVEAKLNALPQIITTIDGLDIHFIHVRSRHPNALPVIITHGWPGSVDDHERGSQEEFRARRVHLRQHAAHPRRGVRFHGTSDPQRP
jgi:Epoxide hydrolase N terminus